MGLYVSNPFVFFIFLLLWMLYVKCQSQVEVQLMESNFTVQNNESSLVQKMKDSYYYVPLHDLQQGGMPICDERCGLPYDGGKRIMGGSSTTPNQYPWMVSLEIVYADVMEMGMMKCGATLIKKQYLLTAAHCIYQKKVLSITAFVGYHYLDIKKFEKTGHEDIIPVAKAFVHDGFDLVTMQHDIAVLELARPVRFTDQVHTICLMKEKLLTKTEATVAGWGLTQAFGTNLYPQMLLSTSLPMVSLKECRRYYRAIGKMISDDSICAGKVDSDVCLGDSGGPLMLKTRSSTFVTRYNQIGVVSWGVQCGEFNFPSIYPNVQHHFLWIQEVTRKDKCLPYPPKPSWKKEK